MQQITGGRIVYGRTVQPAQYESKKAEVELTFAVEEGAGEAAVLAMIDYTAAIAESKCLGMVGLKAREITVSAAPTLAQSTSSKEEAAAKMNAKGKPGPKPKAKKEESPAPSGDILDLSPKQETAQITTNPENRVDPTQDDPDGLGTETVEITDTELLDAVTKRNAATSKSAEIRALRDSYKVKMVKDIPQEHRKDFLEKLAAIT